MSKVANDRLLKLPIPLIMGLPGFRSKYWLYHEETGDYQLRHQWDAVADARRHADSFAMKFMTGRSLRGSVSFGIQEGAAER